MKKWTRSTAWKYKCPDGTDTYITVGTVPLTFYTVYDAPKCNATLYTKDILDICVGWASSCYLVNTQDSPANIPHQVQHGAKAWVGDYGYKMATGVYPNPFTAIPAQGGGDCLAYADLMAKGCQVLGVTASQVAIQNGSHGFFATGTTPWYISADGDIDCDNWNNDWETGYPGTITESGGYSYINASDKLNPFDQAFFNSNTPWNAHGACDCAGHWWEITFNSSPDHGTQALMCTIPNGPVMKCPAPNPAEATFPDDF